jgi:hypothetical protein
MPVASFDNLRELCSATLVAVLAFAGLFSLNRGGIAPGFRVWPASRREWLVYYFHTLEAVTLAVLSICMLDLGNGGPELFAIVLGSIAVLLVSSLAVWPWDRPLCYRELVFCLWMILLLTFVFPVAHSKAER